MAEFFLCHWDRRRKKIISMVPRTSTSPRMDIISSNSADHAGQVSPCTISGNTPFLLYLHCYLTRKALPDSHSSTLITISSTRFHRFRVPLPWSRQRPVTRSSTLACTLTRKWIYSPTYFLIRDSTSVCSLNDPIDCSSSPRTPCKTFSQI